MGRFKAKSEKRKAESGNEESGNLAFWREFVGVETMPTTDSSPVVPPPPRKRRRLPAIPLRDKLIVFALLAQVLYLAIVMGGVNWWAQPYSLAMAVLTFLLLAVPLPGDSTLPPEQRPRAIVIRLLCFPPFWLGFALITYVWIQSWNTQWVMTFFPGGGRRMVWQETIEWLPTGIIAPLEQSNPFRGMLFIIIPWLSLCTLWSGIHSRRAFNFFLHSVAVIFIAWGSAALYQHYNEFEKILGIWDTHPRKLGRDRPFWGTLINENHGAFFLILGTGYCLGLCLRGFVSSAKRFQSGGWYLLYIPSALWLSYATVLAESRGAIGMLLLLWAGFIFISCIFFVHYYGLKGTIFPVAVVTLVLVFGWITLSDPDRFERLKDEYHRTLSLEENPEAEGRYFMWKVTNDMIADSPWFGHGAGSFRYIYLRYVPPHQDIALTYSVRELNPETGRYHWVRKNSWFRQAHLDLSEFLIEWGIIGCSFVVLAWLWGLAYLLFNIRTVDYGQVTILWAGLVLIIGASWEFHFRVPLVALTWCLLMTAVVKSTSLRKITKRSFG
jgi:hypothetical protein